MSGDMTWFKGAPGNWPTVRTKFLFTRQQRPVRETDDIVTAFRDGQVALRRNRRTDGFTNAAKEIGYQGIRKGDLVVHAMDAFAGAVGVAEDDGKSTPVYSVCTPKRPDIFTPYYARLLRHMALSGFVESLSKGVRERSTEFRWAELSEVSLPVPPAAEQERIANFLDEQTARIDSLIAQKESLQVLLQEEQQSCIDRAVLGGVDTAKHFPFMPSTQVIAGKTWVRCMLKQRWTVTDCKHLTVEFVDSGIPLASIREVNGNSLDLSQAKMCSVQDYENLVQGRRQPQFGDLIYARNASVGAVASVDVDQCFAMGQDVCLITSIQDDQKFLRFQLLSSPLKAQLESLLQGATIRRINVEQIRSFALFVPPPEIQRNVVAQIEKELGVRAALQGHCKEHINRLREYRSSLISAAVTGQLDINTYREAA